MSKHNKIIGHFYRLCYYDDPWLYFSPDFKNQWGDDWDDFPYQHNAGKPYGDYVKIAICSNDVWLISPADKYGEFAEDYSVKEINEDNIPWLRSYPDNKKDKEENCLFPGATLNEAILWLKSKEVEVYLNKEMHEN